MAGFVPKLIDTHGHINFNAFKDDGEEVIQRALDEGVGLIMPGSQIDTSRRAVEYAKRWNHPYVKAAIGLHPIHLEDIEVDRDEVENQPKFHTRKEEFRRAAYEDLIKEANGSYRVIPAKLVPERHRGAGIQGEEIKDAPIANRLIVAVGEIGLDYWRLPEDAKEQEPYKARQIDALNSQLDLALDYNLPGILHCRKAHDDLLSILESHEITRKLSPPGVIHCYTGGKKQLKAFLALGYYIGYNGIIFKMNLNDVIKETPLDRVLLETDSPYLTPTKLGDVRNEPINVKYVAQKIAEIKGVLIDEVARQTTENARKLFKSNI